LIDTAGRLTAEALALKTKINELLIDKSKLEEGYARKERDSVEKYERVDRELRHMVGLEQKRNEQDRQNMVRDAAAAKREAIVAVREENLVAERKQFAEQIEFNNTRYEKTEKMIVGIMTDVLKRLPDINANLHVGLPDGVKKVSTGRK
jgi:hypothetical protein